MKTVLLALGLTMAPATPVIRSGSLAVTCYLDRKPVVELMYVRLFVYDPETRRGKVIDADGGEHWFTADTCRVVRN